MNERETLRRLRQWDPVAAAEPPGEELLARIRARLAEAEGQGGASGWLDNLWAVAAVTAAGAILVAVTLARIEHREDAAAEPASATLGIVDEDARPTQVVYTASNGVRIYWSVPAASTSRM